MYSGTIINVMLCCLLHLLGIVIFLGGFFPLKPAVDDAASVADKCFTLKEDCCHGDVTVAEGSDCLLQPVYERLVFIVIDALRTDFVLPDVDQAGEYTSCSEPRMSELCRHIVDRQTASFHATAHPPTVTMPRIKV